MPVLYNLEILLFVGAKVSMATLLLYAGIAKGLDRRNFVEVVGDFALLPSGLVRAVAAGLPAAEILVGLALVSSIFLERMVVAWAGAASGALFAMFGTAIAINLLRGRADISCGCLGKNGRRLTWGLVGRAWVCMLISVLTLPVFQGRVASGSVRDRASLALVSIAVIAVGWLGRFIVSGGAAAFDSPSS
jgi:methylamine utilization protein MauE